MPTGPRPGGRSARVRAAVLRATGDALADSGLDSIELPAIAEAAGVGRTTVYRRWGSVPALVTDLLNEMADSSEPRAALGDLREDLLAQAHLVQRTLADPRQGPLFRALIAAASCDDHTAVALRRFYDRRIDEWVPCVTEAIERGEAPPGTDARRTIRYVAAPLYHHFLTQGRRPTPDDADLAATVTLCAVRDGAFVVG